MKQEYLNGGNYDILHGLDPEPEPPPPPPIYVNRGEVSVNMMM